MTKKLNIEKFLIGLSGFRVVASLLCVFTYFSGPHYIRQIDTLGVSFRYFLRFSDSMESFKTIFLPAVLTAGDSIGITPMEFPILNLFFAPFFFGGHFFGITSIRFFVIILNLLLIYLNYREWEGEELNGVKLSKAFLFIPILSIGQTYIDKFMPDLTAFLLLSLAMGYQLGKKKKNRLLSFVCASLGLLIKPPVVIALGPMLFLLKPRDLIKEISLWIIPSLVVCLLYYTLGTGYLKELSDLPPYFAVHFRDPFSSLIGVFSKPKLLFSFFVKDVFNSYILILILGWDIYVKAFKKQIGIPNKYWAVLALQLLCVFALADSHLYLHNYYAIGSSFLAILIILTFLKRCHLKYLCILVTLAVSVNQIETILHRMKPFRKEHLFKQCREIKKKIDFQNVKKIRSNYSPYPTLGLCLGVIQNSKVSKYGVYFKDEISEEWQKIFETKDLIVIDHKSEKEK